MRLEDPVAIYKALAALQVGDAVPEQVYILDEKNGIIPRWVLIYRRPTGATEQLALIVEDQTPRNEQPSLFGPQNVRVGLLTWARKTLTTRPYLCETLEWQCPRSMMGDLGQHARHANQRERRHVKAVA